MRPLSGADTAWSASTSTPGCRPVAATYPELPLVESRLDELTSDRLSAAGQPTSYDLVVCVGNVMVLLAPDTERTVLAALGSLLAPDGRILVGFSLSGAPAPTSRSYAVDEFAADCAAVGLAVESRFASYDLRPFVDGSDYAVHVLRRAEGAVPA